MIVFGEARIRQPVGHVVIVDHRRVGNDTYHWRRRMTCARGDGDDNLSAVSVRQLCTVMTSCLWSKNDDRGQMILKTLNKGAGGQLADLIIFIPAKAPIRSLRKPRMQVSDFSPYEDKIELEYKGDTPPVHQQSWLTVGFYYWPTAIL